MPTRELKVFDAHHPPSIDLISDCVHCGFCLATCPTYKLWGQEPDSPRGRIYLMKLALDDELKLDANYVRHFDQCLGCMACLTSCPSGVEYEKLIEATRAQIQRRFPRSQGEKLFRQMIFSLFPHPMRLRFIALALLAYQRSGLQSLVHKNNLLARLPIRLKAMENLLPQVNSSAIFSQIKTRSPKSPRLRVGLMLGCVARVFFDEVNLATVRVLEAEGCEVIIPPDQSCCGALAGHAGEETLAMHSARRTIDAFAKANVDVIAINAAGCGSAMKEYAHLLRDDKRYAERAARFATRCGDISEIVATLSPQRTRHPLELRVAYHDACHLQHAQRITAQPRGILRTIPGLELLEIEDAGICCGSAGIYNLLEPETAKELGIRKAQHILKAKPDAVVSGNPGCTLQIKSSLDATGNRIAVLHWIQLLDASIRNKLPVRVTNLS